MTPQHVVVLERESALTAELERAFLESPEITFRWIPYLIDLTPYLEIHHCDLVIADCSKPDKSLLTQLGDLCLKHRFLVTIPDNELSFELLLRELGVVSVFPAQFETAKLIRSVKKLLSTVVTIKLPDNHELQTFPY